MPRGGRPCVRVGDPQKAQRVAISALYHNQGTGGKEQVAKERLSHPLFDLYDP